MTERELLAGYVAGSGECFAKVVAMHVNLVYSVALRQVAESNAAEDVVQEVFLRLARKAKEIKPEVPLAGWLFTTTRLVCLQTKRGDARRKRREQEAAMSESVSTDPTWGLIAEDVDKAVADLPATDRDALLLRFFSGKTHPEIAEILAISEEAAKKRVQRGLDALQVLLTSRGVATGSVVTAVTLAGALSRHAVQAAPPALAGSVTSAVAAKGATVGIAAKGAVLAGKVKAGLIGVAAVTAIIGSAGVAVYMSKGRAGTAAPVADATAAVAESIPETAPADAAANPWDGPHVAPFQAIRWTGDVPEVQVNGTWYEWLGIDGLSTNDVVAFAKKADKGWRRRVDEDLPALLGKMGHLPGDSVTLKVKNLGTGAEETLTQVAMTEENRRAIRDSLPNSPQALDAWRNAPQVSPFVAVRWNVDTPEVQVTAGGAWYQLLSVDGVSADELFKFAAKQDPDPQWRVGEDLVAVLMLMGHTPGQTVNVELKDLTSGNKETQQLEMTAQKRRQLMRAGQAAR